VLSRGLLGFELLLLLLLRSRQLLRQLARLRLPSLHPCLAGCQLLLLLLWLFHESCGQQGQLHRHQRWLTAAAGP
jgi:hypothetical protein